MQWFPTFLCNSLKLVYISPSSYLAEIHLIEKKVAINYKNNTLKVLLKNNCREHSTKMDVANINVHGVITIIPNKLYKYQIIDQHEQ